MAAKTTPTMEVPPEMRDFAEKSVEQAKKAFDGYINAAQKAVSTLEGSAEAMQAGAKDMGKKAMGFAEANVAASFELAQKLVRAKDVQEFMKIQAEYVQDQMKSLSEQAKAFGETAQKAMQSAKPKA